MGHIYIQWKRSKENYKTFPRDKNKIAFRTTNTIQNILRHQPLIDKYSRSGIYQMKCLDCPLKYIGQQEGHLTLDTKNIYMPLETIIIILDIRTTY
jgi:hypothetical protein